MRRLGLPAVAAIVILILAFDIFVLPPALNVLFAPRNAPAKMPPLALAPPDLVLVLEARTAGGRQLILKPAKDSPDQNAFHDEALNRRVLGLASVRWRFHVLVVANFSRTEPFRVDLAETPLEVRLEPGRTAVRALTAAEVLAEAGSAVPRSGAVLLEALGRGAGRVVLPPASLASILVALPADLFAASPDARIASASLLFAGETPSADHTLLPATVRKEDLDDFLLSPAEPIDVRRGFSGLSLEDSREDREYGLR